MSATIRAPHTTAWLDDDGIFRIRHDSDATIELNDAREIVEAWMDFFENNAYPHLVDFRGIRVSQDPEAREYFASHHELHKIVKATAILVDDLANTMTSNFFVKFNKPAVPTQVFRKEEEAIEWLRQFVD